MALKCEYEELEEYYYCHYGVEVSRFNVTIAVVIVIIKVDDKFGTCYKVDIIRSLRKALCLLQHLYTD